MKKKNIEIGFSSDPFISLVSSFAPWLKKESAFYLKRTSREKGMPMEDLQLSFSLALEKFWQIFLNEIILHQQYNNLLFFLFSEH